MRVPKRLWVGLAVFAMLITPLAMAGFWVYRRGSLYRAAATSLPAELQAAKAEGLPLTPADLERPIPVPDEQNAAPLYVQLVASTAAIKDNEALDVGAGRATEAQKRSMRRLLITAAPQLKLVEKAANLPSCDFQRNWSLGPSLLLKEYAPMRKMVRLLAAEAALQSEAGHPEAALRTIRTGARMARHCGEDPILIAFLVRIALEAVLDRPFENLIKKYGDRPDILRLAAKTELEFGDMPDARHGMTGEVVLCRIIAAMIRQDEKDPELRLTAAIAGTTPLTVANAYEDRSISFWRKTFSALNCAKKDPMAAYLAAKVVSDDHEAISTENGKQKPTYEMDAMLSPYFSTAEEKVVELEARRRIRHTLIALLQYRNSHGRFPDALSQLSPPAPTDPFVSKPLHYRTTPHGFLLYSIGKNLIDDGGKGTPRKKGETPPDIVAAFP